MKIGIKGVAVLAALSTGAMLAGTDDLREDLNIKDFQNIDHVKIIQEEIGRSLSIQEEICIDMKKGNIATYMNKGDKTPSQAVKSKCRIK